MFEKLSLILMSSSRITFEPADSQPKLSPQKYGPVLGRILYFSMALLNAKDFILMKRHTVSQFRELIEAHPEAIPNVFWPYQCSSWNSSNRIDFLHNHFLTLPNLNYQIEFRENHQRIIADADDIYPGLQIVVDQQRLFIREGMISLNIYVGHARVFTIAFSVFRDDEGRICAIAGSIQGRRMDNITELYRDMTKKTFGIRPRDLMVEVFQIVCKLMGIEKIYAVSESHRQHKHHFYRLQNKQRRPSLNYDEVWRNRSGIRCNDAFYELPVTPVRKPLRHIIAKKRSMYRNRYALLQRLEEEIGQGLSAFAPWTFREPLSCDSDIGLAEEDCSFEKPFPVNRQNRFSQPHWH